VLTAWAFLFAKFPLCRTRSEDSADRIGRKSSTNVLRQESEGEVTQGETECFDRSDRVLLGEPANSRPGESGLFIMMVCVYILQSKSTGRFYCGQTTDVDRRLRQHNDPQYYLSKTTKRFNRAEHLNDLRVPPANRLEKLKGDRLGQHSIRINDQWRICFIWHDRDALQVEIVDYH
jgi:proteic killer suppression protein